MASLTSLIETLKQRANCTDPPFTQPLSDAQYSDGFDSISQGAGWSTYQNFIIPQLNRALTPLFNSRDRVSVLEIGPGPKSVLGYLPGHQRQKITRYTAFERSELFATRLENLIGQIPHGDEQDEKYDIVLFCHSMYGMSPQRKYIEKALELLVPLPAQGLVVVFHREETLDVDGLVPHRTASFSEAFLSIDDDDETLDSFAAFVTGSAVQNDTAMGRAIQYEWRKACRDLGRHDDGAHQGRLMFGTPEVMKAFTQHAAALPQLIAKVPCVTGDRMVKNREARLHQPAAIIRPTEIQHIQECVRWATEHSTNLTVIGGGHGGQCVWPDSVAVDMDAFNHVDIVMPDKANEEQAQPLLVVGTGCKAGDIISKASESGLTVPLGSRPSVGAGLWLQGGIGHLARQHGLTCDAIVGAVLILCVGNVPVQHRPADAIRPDNEANLLWAIKGAGTNFGIVLSVTFKSFAAPTYSVRDWKVPLDEGPEAVCLLRKFDEAAKELPRNCSADAYLYGEADKLYLSVTMYEASTNTATTAHTTTSMQNLLGPEIDLKIVDGTGLFDTEMYISGMHGGNGGGKTSSIKRCVFLKAIGSKKIANLLISAMETRPSPCCYLHLLQGGGAVRDIAANSTAFGCRDWDFACVVTGVWSRDQDGTETAQAAVRWVYSVVEALLPLSNGVYGADLGPDPRDAPLAIKAFGPNRPRLACLKKTFDPQNVLAYACPLLNEAPREPRLIVLVTGESGAGKDHCANLWACVFNRQRKLKARVASISDATKREYAAASDADINRLLYDRAYKERHRTTLTEFYEDKLRGRPRLAEEHFLDVVYDAANSEVDALLITGMRDESPVSGFAHLVPDSRVIEVRVQASQATREIRRGQSCLDSASYSDDNDGPNPTTSITALDSDRPTFVFDNDAIGEDEWPIEFFAERNLLPYFSEKLEKLRTMVRVIPDFPQPGVEFRHTLGIAQQTGGLELCTSLLQSHFNHGDWTYVDNIATCEAGGYVFASALAARVGVPLALIREEGKLPPPTVSMAKSSPSYITSMSAESDDKKGEETNGKRIVMDRDAVARGASVVVVDDVLASGATLCAILHLLGEAGVSQANISVLVVAEFPVHRGRQLLLRRGFGGVRMQSLLVFGGN
ncbi:phosphoribosyl transferase domain protein [Apiospora hydei]|uniref:Phosphoribosyl transferase domain protein n=1 Tax=Apiospora hydei TaxID=1337664 RepID=A0ABR1V6H7_9PEZI